MKKMAFASIVMVIAYSFPAIAAQDFLPENTDSKTTLSQQLRSFSDRGNFKTAAMCLSAGEELNGSSKTCFYNCPTGRKSISVSGVYPNKGTKCDIGLSLISDAHDCLPAGFKMAC
ncbi:hypothetical protein GGR95_003791, partial [Sulfitobacter undariae]